MVAVEAEAAAAEQQQQQLLLQSNLLQGGDLWAEEAEEVEEGVVVEEEVEVEAHLLLPLVATGQVEAEWLWLSLWVQDPPSYLYPATPGSHPRSSSDQQDFLLHHSTP